ncbi:hypothetical protein L873DRAFT_1661951 [Choiromyces venosus 120613-1]|uniref:G-protein coupled receptors family 1 profile domain-containing protein n=1 Tax=Choiromyces venosus 120613-1 TaxID=1336337 RepID=A0A3N4K5C8_9PEZI|nr:hypothetical protein L873DRAFT_1661951 [Choiromyces venosus 120613-1]
MDAIYPAMRELIRRAVDEESPSAQRKQSKGSFVYSISLAMVAITVISFCLARRLVGIHDLSSVPLARWLILIVFLDSWLFVLSSTILQASFGLNSSLKTCDAGILLCLVCYLSSKVFIYFFLVEKVFIVRRGNRSSRFKDKLFLFNTCGMLLPYCVVITLTFVFRNAEIDEKGQCKIGLKLPANIPLLIFDMTINIYLTILFLKPLHGLWSFQNGTKLKQGRLHRVAFRTFIGSCATLVSTLGNLVSLIVLRGKEPGWICLTVCTSDILFSVLVLHWVTNRDDDNLDGKTRCGECDRSMECRGDPYSISRGSNFDGAGLSRDRKGRVTGGGGEVVTSIHAVPKGGCNHNKSIPLDGILTHTEVRRDIESLGGTSETEEENDPRVNSTDNIRQSTCSRP